MKDRNLLIVFVALIIIIIILFGVVFSMVGGSSKKKVTTVDKEYQKKVQQVNSGKVSGKYETDTRNSYYYNLDQDGRDLIDKIIDDVVDVINNKNYESIYAKLKDYYKNALFPNLEDLEKYMKEQIPSGTEVVAKNFRVDGSALYINLQESGTEKKVLNLRVDYYNKYFDNPEGCKIYFSDVGYIAALRSLWYVDPSIRIEAEYIFEYADHVSYVLQIDNRTKETVKIDFKDTKLREYYYGTEAVFDMVTTRYVEIPVGESVRYELGFKTPKHEPDGIQLNMIINGKEVNKYIYITPSSMEED